MSAAAAPAAVLIPAPRSSADGDAVGVLLPGVRFRLVVGEEQDVLYTASRRSEPRAWLRSVVWLVAAGLHPEAGPSTVVVAEDLAGRMDYRRGIVVYDLAGTARRTGMSVASVKRHVKVLRELGALVWLVRGSKRNLALPGEPYMATATIYGAVIPVVYDEAMGHRLAGSGYEGRVCGVSEAGRERAVTEAAVRSQARQAGRHRTGRSQWSGTGARRNAGTGQGRGLCLWKTGVWITPAHRAVSPILLVVTTDHLKCRLRVVVNTPRASARAAPRPPLPREKPASTATGVAVPLLRHGHR